MSSTSFTSFNIVLFPPLQSPWSSVTQGPFWTHYNTIIVNMFLVFASCSSGLSPWMISNASLSSYIVTPWLYLCLTCLIPDIIFSLCVPPTHFPLHTGLLWTLLLSWYLTVMSHYVTHHSSFPLCTDSPTHTFHSILTPLWLLFIVMPMHHSVLQLLTQTLLWCVFLPCCASTGTSPAAYMYFYNTRDMFFPQYIRMLVICQVASDLVCFVNNRTINSIRASLISLSSKLYFTLYNSSSVQVLKTLYYLTLRFKS